MRKVYFAHCSRDPCKSVQGVLSKYLYNVYFERCAKYILHKVRETPVRVCNVCFVQCAKYTLREVRETPAP